jgi:hypothetical protein
MRLPIFALIGIEHSLRDVGKGLSEFTVGNNIKIMMFMPKNIDINLDKLTQADIKKYKVGNVIQYDFLISFGYSMLLKKV